MEMQQQYILTASIFYFGLVYVQLQKILADHVDKTTEADTNKVHDESGIRENLQSFLDSIAKNNSRKGEIYHNVLKQEVVREQQAFDVMKRELWTAQNRNAHKKRNFYDKNIINEAVIATKREANENTDVSLAGSASQELPGDLDKFEDLRANNKIYVDKTNYIAKLLRQNDKFISICRPRRFGKSNFLQMLKSYFQANRTFFEGLDVYARHDWQPRPVIYLDFNAMAVQSVDDFKTDMAKLLRQIGESYGYTLSNAESAMTLLDELIYELSGHDHNFESIVVLVDEYDWPVRRNADADNNVGVLEMSNFLREFFQKMRQFGSKIKLLLMTCTVPLQLRNSKGGLDFLKDITYDPQYNEMIGLTDTELRSSFKSHIEKMVRQPNETFQLIVQDMRKRYNGYCFSKRADPTCRVYNFHSVISAMRNKNITNYWHANVDPKFNTINTYQEEEYRRHVGTLNFFTNYTVPRNELQTQMDFNNPTSMIACMVVYGYLTFRGYKEDTDEFILDFPNEEVREKFIKEVLEPVPLGKLPVHEVRDRCETLRQTMFEVAKCKQFIENLNQMAFTDEPANVGEEEDTERDYPDHIIRVFQICDIKNHYSYALFRQDFSLAYTIDLLAERANSSEQYIFEFGPVEQAMKKLLDLAEMPEFKQKFNGQKTYLMGIKFSAKGGIINEWIRVTYDKGQFSGLKASNSKYKKMFAYVTNSTATSTESVVGRSTSVIRN